MEKKKEEKVTLIDAFKDFKEEKNIDRPVMMGVLKDVFLTQIAKTYGIKAVTPVSSKATVSIYEAVLHLKSKGCKAVILGCTELPLVFPGKDEFEGVKLIDPTEILAIELIRSTCPEKLI